MHPTKFLMILHCFLGPAPNNISVFRSINLAEGNISCTPDGHMLLLAFDSSASIMVDISFLVMPEIQSCFKNFMQYTLRNSSFLNLFEFVIKELKKFQLHIFLALIDGDLSTANILRSCIECQRAFLLRLSMPHCWLPQASLCVFKDKKTSGSCKQTCVS